MLRWFKSLFCSHQWEQRLWLVNESAFLCLKCDRIEFRDGPGGPLPEGVSTSKAATNLPECTCMSPWDVKPGPHHSLSCPRNTALNTGASNG